MREVPPGRVARASRAGGRPGGAPTGIGSARPAARARPHDALRPRLARRSGDARPLRAERTVASGRDLGVQLRRARLGGLGHPSNLQGPVATDRPGVGRAGDRVPARGRRRTKRRASRARGRLGVGRRDARASIPRGVAPRGRGDRAAGGRSARHCRSWIPADFRRGACPPMGRHAAGEALVRQRRQGPVVAARVARGLDSRSHRLVPRGLARGHPPFGGSLRAGVVDRASDVDPGDTARRTRHRKRVGGGRRRGDRRASGRSACPCLDPTHGRGALDRRAARTVEHSRSRRRSGRLVVGGDHERRGRRLVPQRPLAGPATCRSGPGRGMGTARLRCDAGHDGRHARMDDARRGRRVVPHPAMRSEGGRLRCGKP